uniref:Protein kinase domain-containing protein n=1 Tax=Romanomermis culicivorax TaxID=13658 RepID=A0A915JMJ5_ROMCU
PNTLPYENYQGSPDSPNPLEDQVIIEPLPEIIKNRNFNNNNNNESQQFFRPKSMDFNNAINKGLIDGDHSEWTKTPSKISFQRNHMKYIQEIGQGWFGQVVEGEVNSRIRGESVSIFDDKLDKIAVQILSGDLTSVEKGYVLYGAQKFRVLEHPNLVKLVAAYFETQPYLLVYQYFGQKNDLKHYLVKNRANCDNFLENNFLLSYAWDVAQGLAFLHENGYTFKYIYQPQQLVGKEYTVINGVAIPIRWAAPETLFIEDSYADTFSFIIKEIDKKANVWLVDFNSSSGHLLMSFGVTMWEILEFAKLPYMSLNDSEVVQKVIKQKLETLAEPLVPMRFRDKW